MFLKVSLIRLAALLNEARPTKSTLAFQGSLSIRLEEFRGRVSRIADALEDLIGKADRENLIRRQFDNAQQIVEQLESKEAA